MMSRTSILAAAACLALASAAHAQSGSTGATTTYDSGGSSMSGSTSMNTNQDTVRQVQQGLKDKGHDPGPIDGVMGPQTQSALREFQQSQGMNASGTLDQDTMGALGVEQDRSGSGAPSGQDKTTSPSQRDDATSGSSGVGSSSGSSGSGSSGSSGSMSGSTEGSGAAGTAPNRSGSGSPSGSDKTTSPTQR